MDIESKSPRPMNVTRIDTLPEPLKRVRGQASKLLANMLASMFDNADDVLFELADKAVNNTDQTMYFDSMREVRIKREAMETCFGRATQDHFKLFFLGPAAQQIDNEKIELSGTDLSLLQDDELEESVAIRGMISKANNQFGESLGQLTQRMDSLTSSTVDEENNPLGSAKLIDAFQQACQELELDIRARLVVFKLFEKFVISELGELYTWSNQSLIESGVLPQIETTRASKTPGRSANQAADSHARPSSAEGFGSGTQEDEVFSVLRGLLADSAAQQSQPSGDQLHVTDSGPALSYGELVEMLSVVQHQGHSVDAQDSFQPERVDVRKALYDLMNNSASDKLQSVRRADDDSINLVSMLFEFILDDHNLPVPMKALLGRLQIPMLKVALLDKTFFSLGSHPARRLLNELAKAALSWNEPPDLERDALFNKINAVVGTVLNDFDSDVGIFAPLLDDFNRFIDADRRKASLIEQRTRDAEEGLGKTQRARAEVGKLINEKAAGKQLPDVVVELLRDGWSNYLFLLFVKQDAGDEAWGNAVQVIDDLIWSVENDTSFGRRSELLKMIPSLLKSLREGLNTVSFSKNRMRELFSDLEGIHMECLKRKPQEAEAAAQDITGEGRGEVASNLSSSPDTPRVASLGPAEKVATTPVILDAPELESLDAQTTVDIDGDEFVAMVDSMAVGAWVELVSKDDEKSRCKLAAIIRASGKYIFVNRVGIKVSEYTRLSLIEAARQGVITMLDNALLFDRALESVIGHLREMKD